MAIDLTTPAATPSEYRGDNQRSSSDFDTPLGVTLLSVTRWAESRIGLAPGMLLPQTALTFTFDARGGTELFLADDAGQYLCRSITADSLKIDSDNDGAFDDYLFDTADAWVLPLPINAAQLGAGWTSIVLKPVTTAPLTEWPTARACVQIVGDWGCAATSTMRLVMKQRIIQVARELIEIHAAGPTLTVADIDATLSLNPSGRSLLRMFEQEANYSIPSIG